MPAAELSVINDNIGLPNNINLARSDSVTVGPADGEILVALQPGHAPTAGYLKILRNELPKRFPNLEFFSQPADIVSQILNFGLPAPIDVQVSGPPGESDKNYQIARQIERDLAVVPGAVDVHVQQILSSPRLMVDTDRIAALQSGLTEQDVANSLSVSLTGSGTATTNFWLNVRNGVQYSVVVQTPQHRVSSIDDLGRTSIIAAGQTSPQLLSNLATIRRTSTPLSLNHYNVQPLFDVTASVQGTDLGSVSNAVDRIVAKHTAVMSKASTISVRGQAQSMKQSFSQLALGIGFAILLVYLLMVVNFQSWLHPFIILMALPGALAGILWMLFVTGTTLSVPALMGCIMAVGVATSNSILMVTFANQQRLPEHGSHDSRADALAAGGGALAPPCSPFRLPPASCCASPRETRRPRRRPDHERTERRRTRQGAGGRPPAGGPSRAARPHADDAPHRPRSPRSVHGPAGRRRGPPRAQPAAAGPSGAGREHRG